MIKKNGHRTGYNFPESLRNELLLEGLTEEDIKKFRKVIYGDSGNDFYSEYTLTSYSEIPDEDTWWQRLNCFWVYPLFIACIPFRYVLYGDYRVQPNSKVYHIISKLVGENK